LAYGSLSQRLIEETRLNEFFVYFLQSKKDGTFYIGQTNNIDNRIKKHNKGLIKSTKTRTPFDLVYFESYNTRHKAMLREKHLKSIAGVKEKKTIIAKLHMGL
jgi:putative endonuclease